MRISDCSSDVCSSDLESIRRSGRHHAACVAAVAIPPSIVWAFSWNAIPEGDHMGKLTRQWRRPGRFDPHAFITFQCKHDTCRGDAWPICRRHCTCIHVIAPSRHQILQLHVDDTLDNFLEIGSASGREKWCQYV